MLVVFNYKRPTLGIYYKQDRTGPPEVGPILENARFLRCCEFLSKFRQNLWQYEFQYGPIRTTITTASNHQINVFANVKSGPYLVICSAAHHGPCLQIKHGPSAQISHDRLVLKPVTALVDTWSEANYVDRLSSIALKIFTCEWSTSDHYYYCV